MLDLHQLRDQFPDFSHYQLQEQQRLVDRLGRCQELLAMIDPDWERLRDDVSAASPRWLVARLLAAPASCTACPTRPTPITVVASDGSQIYPDRHVEPTCYVLNVSRIAFQYGTLEQPLMEAVPAFHYRKDDLADLEDLLQDNTPTTDLVSAVRDELELKELLKTAQACRQPGRPVVAMADGTLIRWMLSGLRNPALEARLTEQYIETLATFEADRLPVCSYISMPGNTEVINLLRFAEGETEDTPREDSLAGPTDRHLFAQCLAPGERTALFESASHIQSSYGAQKICYFYVRVPSRTAATEIGRVEVPQWVASDPEMVDLVHAVVVSECEKGDGYPMILSEAHERAVIRAHEKALFYDLIEQQLRAAGLPATGSRKAASKRRPMV